MTAPDDDWPASGQRDAVRGMVDGPQIRFLHVQQAGCVAPRDGARNPVNTSVGFRRQSLAPWPVCGLKRTFDLSTPVKQG